MLSTRLLNLQKQYPDPMVPLVVYNLVAQVWVAAARYSVRSEHVLTKDVDLLPPEEVDMRGIFSALIHRRFNREPFPPGLGGGPTVVTFVTRVEELAEEFYGPGHLREYANEQITGGIKRYPELFGESKLEALIPWLARIVTVAVKTCRRVSNENLRKLHKVFLAAPNRDRRVELVSQWLDAVLAAREASLALEILNRDVDLIADWVQATRPNIMNMSVVDAMRASDLWHADEDRRRQEEQARLQIARKEKLKRSYSTPMFVYGPYGFYELKDEDALIDEGVCQHHCVAGYWQKVKSGEVNIYSVRSSFEKRVATIEVRCLQEWVDAVMRRQQPPTDDDEMARVVCRENQVRGPANQQVTDAQARAAIGAFFAAQGIVSQEFRAEIDAAKAQHPPATLSGILYGRQGVRGLLAGFGRRR